MADKKLTEVNTVTEMEPIDKIVANVNNGVRQISVNDLTNIIKSIIGSLKNPNKLRFVGTVNTQYDGSEEITVSFPDSYTLPVATNTKLGGVKPRTKANVDTVEVAIDASGRLWAPTYPSISSDDINYLIDNSPYVVKVNQGAINAGKFLAVDSQGQVYAADAPTGGGSTSIDGFQVNDPFLFKSYDLVNQGTLLAPGEAFTEYYIGSGQRNNWKYFFASFTNQYGITAWQDTSTGLHLTTLFFDINSKCTVVKDVGHLSISHFDKLVKELQEYDNKLIFPFKWV